MIIIHINGDSFDKVLSLMIIELIYNEVLILSNLQLSRPQEDSDVYFVIISTITDPNS